MIDETRQWLERASADLRAAEVLRGAGLREEALYHCQQAAEKALKAYLTWHQVAFRKTHDLDELKLACVAVDPALKSTVDGIETLSVYAWRFRYPGAPVAPAEQDIEEAHHAATVLFAALKTDLDAATSEP